MMRNEYLDKYLRDKDSRSFDDLMVAYRPLVMSVCRRHLSNLHDAEDAAQETFIKLATKAGTIHSNLASWLHTTAYSTCVDIIRRQARERARIEGAAHNNSDAGRHRMLLWQIASERLQAAMACLDESSRSLLEARFLYCTSLRVIAGVRDVSVATISRQVWRAVESLGAVFRDMGLDSLDNDTLAEHLMEFGRGAMGHDADYAGLRIAPDWAAPSLNPVANDAPPTGAAMLPGWPRPIRVGIFVSYQTIFTPALDGWNMPVEDQVRTLRFSSGLGYQCVGLVEPGTSAYAPIERTLRDYGITAGLIDITDIESLLTLDVIYLGWSYAVSTAALEAVASAVSHGVGLYNEHFTSQLTTNMSDPRIRRLMLAQSEIGFSHSTPCMSPQWATYQKRHPAFPGISPGTPILISGCGPLYKPVHGAEVLMTRNDIVEPNDPNHSLAVPAMRIPALVVGELGRGRVIVLNAVNPDGIFRHRSYQGDYLANVFRWLAEPRREFVQAATSPGQG